MIRRGLLNLVGSVAAQLSPTAGQQLACPAAEAAVLTSAHRVLAASICWGSQQPFASILGLHQQQQQLHTSVCSAAGSSQTPQHHVQIGRIGPAAGSRKTVSVHLLDVHLLATIPLQFASPFSSLTRTLRLFQPPDTQQRIRLSCPQLLP